MGTVRDLAGQRFGRLRVLETKRVEVNVRRVTMNLCLCDCGETHRVRSDGLLGGKASRGCTRCTLNRYPNKYEFLPDACVRIHCASSSFIIDEADFPEVSSYQWHKRGRYFATKKSGRHTVIHRFLMGLETGDDRVIDHISGDTSDNRRCNLRVCRQLDNSKNQRLSRANNTGYKGVTYNKRLGKYIAQIATERKPQQHLGVFDNPEDAAAAYDRAALLLHGEFARTNADLGLLEVAT